MTWPIKETIVDLLFPINEKIEEEKNEREKKKLANTKEPRALIGKINNRYTRKLAKWRAVRSEGKIILINTKSLE